MATINSTHRQSRRATLITLAVFVAAIFVIRWIVVSQKAPGSMTLIEAQGMDMTTMKTPLGEQPVAMEAVEKRQIGGSQDFPATVMAYSDEEVVARVPGRVVSLAYPGDNVRAGQLVAKVDAQEYLAQVGQAQFSAQASQNMASAAEREVDHMRSAKAQAIADVTAVDATLARAKADKAVALAEVEQMKAQAQAKSADVGNKEAALRYAEQSAKRKKSLFEQGAISQDDYQSAESARGSAEAMLNSAKADAAAAAQAAQASTGKVTAAEAAIKEASARKASALSSVAAAENDIQESQSQARARGSEAKAAARQSAGSSIVAGYTELRALDDAMVADRFVAPGAIVVAGQRLLMLHDARKVRVQARLPQTLASQVSEGTPVVVHYQGMEFKGKLTSVFPTADLATRTFIAEAILPNPVHLLLPGAFATMSVQTSESELRLAVPTAAIQTDSTGGKYVWAVKLGAGAKTDWTCTMHPDVSESKPGECPVCGMDLVPRTRGGKTVATRKSVTLGDSDGVNTAIESGLKDGDQVITHGFETLVEGASIKNVPWGENGPKEMPKVSAQTPPTQKAAKPDDQSMPGMDMGGKK